MSKTYKVVGSGPLVDFVGYGFIYLESEHKDVVYLEFDEVCPLYGGSFVIEFSIETGMYSPPYHAETDLLRVCKEDLSVLQKDLEIWQNDSLLGF